LRVNLSRNGPPNSETPQGPAFFDHPAPWANLGAPGRLPFGQPGALVDAQRRPGVPGKTRSAGEITEEAFDQGPPVRPAVSPGASSRLALSRNGNRSSSGAQPKYRPPFGPPRDDPFGCCLDHARMRAPVTHHAPTRPVFGRRNWAARCTCGGVQTNQFGGRASKAGRQDGPRRGQDWGVADHELPPAVCVR